MIDAHMHVWDLERHYHAWLQDKPLKPHPLGDVSPIAYRAYSIEDYLSDTAGWNVSAAVFVECGLPDDARLSETDWVRGLMKSHGWPHAIVAGASLEAPGAVDLLTAQARREEVRGIRQILNFHGDSAKTYCDSDLLQNPLWRERFSLLSNLGLSFDAQLYPSQMPAAALLAAENPRTAIVINHAGMLVDDDAQGRASWRSGMLALAAQPNVSVKISGLGMTDPAWTVASITETILEVINLFGPKRTMFASNLPVDNLFGDFSRTYRAFAEVVSCLSDEERDDLFYGTAKRIYKIATKLPQTGSRSRAGDAEDGTISCNRLI